MFLATQEVEAEVETLRNEMMKEVEPKETMGGETTQKRTANDLSPLTDKQGKRRVPDGQQKITAFTQSKLSRKLFQKTMADETKVLETTDPQGTTTSEALLRELQAIATEDGGRKELEEDSDMETGEAQFIRITQ